MRKKIFGRAVSIAVLCLLAVVSIGQPAYQSRAIVAQYDLDSTTAISCVLGTEREVPILITTSGSSATVTALTATQAPFAAVAVGDVIYAQSTAGIREGRLVTARASEDSITVDSAVTLSAAGTTFRTRARTCGTAATNGWFNLSGRLANITVQIDQLAVATGAVGAKIECKYGDLSGIATPVNVWPGEASAEAKCNGGTYASGYCTYTTAGIGARVSFSTANITVPDQCRAVFILTGTDDGNDLTTNLEQISVFLSEGR